MTELAPATSKKLDELVRHEIEELARLRDEIRLKVHLGGMEAKSTWSDLEKQLEQLEERFGYEGDHVVETTRQIAVELRAALRDFQNRLL